MFWCRYDGVPDALDVSCNTPPQQLQELASTFYKTKVAVSLLNCTNIELETSQHGCSDAPAHVQWVEQRRRRITSLNVGITALHIILWKQNY